MKDDDLLHKWVNGTLSPEELSIFKSRPEYDSLEALDRNTADLKAPDFSEDEMLQGILKQAKAPTKRPSQAKSIQLGSWFRYAAAACVLLLSGWFLWPSTANEVSYELAKGERQEGLLPDGSSFVLNAESRLWYDADDWGSNRTLKLSGEAFFKVKKGSQFIVKTHNGAVKVLGTEFNVLVRKNKLEVSCNSGKVAVVSRKGVVLAELSPNEVVRVVDDKVKKHWTMDAGKFSSWKEGVSRLEGVPLKVILAELERQFDIEIEPGTVNLDEVGTCMFAHKELDIALKSAFSPFQIKYNKKGRRRVVLTK